MIAYIDLPLRGTYTVNGHDVLVIALYQKEAGFVGAVFIDQDGAMGKAEIGDININWRFDDRRHRWVDVDTGEDLGEEDDGDS